MKHGSTAPRRPAPSRDGSANVAQNGELVSTAELSRLTGVSPIMIRHMVGRKMIPPPVGRDIRGHDLFDTSDPALADWIRRLQAAGYNLR